MSQIRNTRNNGYNMAPACKLGLCVVALIVYLPSLAFGFISDDHLQIALNPQVQSWDYLPRLLTTHLWSQQPAEDTGHYYRPLFSLWMLLVHTFGGLAPWFWHLTSIALHVTVTYFVFQLCRMLFRSNTAAFFAAMLFALHPIHVDSVSWVSASNEILYSLFVLLSLLLCLRATEGRYQDKSLLVASAAIYGGALFSKETALVALPLFFLLAVPPEKARKSGFQALRKALRSVSPFLVCSLIYLFVRWLVLRGVGVETGKHTWSKVVFSAPSIILFYLKKLVWPAGLSTFYLNPLQSQPTAAILAALSLILSGTALLAWLSVRYSREAGIVGGLILLPLIPTLAAVRLYDQGNMTHDRYLYLPSVGLCLLLGWVAKRFWLAWPGGKAVLIAAAVGIFASCAYRTVAQQQYYKTDESFYSRALQIEPNNVLVIDYLGNEYLQQHSNTRALDLFSKAHELAPADDNATYFLARGLFEDQQYSRAEPYLRKLSSSDSISSYRKPLILLSLAHAQMRLNEFMEAEATLARLEILDPRYPGLHRTLAILFQGQGRIPEAQSEYAKEYDVSGDLQSARQAIQLRSYLQSPQRH